MRPVTSVGGVAADSCGCLYGVERTDSVVLDDTDETCESIEWLRAMTGRGSGRLGSMFFGDAGGELGKAGAETFRS
jgi:hypothetical protein